MFATGQSSASVGTAFIYDKDANLLGEYDNGSAKGKGRQEYIWLPTDDGQAIPIGIYRNGKTFAVHADHLGTPRLITDDANKPVWQWPYSAFGNNKPTGVLKASQNPKAAVTNQPVLLKATNAGIEANLRFPGQYFDEESNLSYNYFRSYQAGQGRYTQADPIGLGGGLNRFAYVGGNPLSLVDPRGLSATDMRLALDCVRELFPNLRVPTTFTMGDVWNPITQMEGGGRTNAFTGALTFSRTMYGGRLTDGDLGGLAITATHEVMHANQSFWDRFTTKWRENVGDLSHNDEALDAVIRTRVDECIKKKRNAQSCR